MSRRWRRALLPVLAGGVALALAGCGAAYPDVFLLTRSGTVPGARLTLLVNDGGTVRCNGGAERTLPAPRLLDARRIAEDLSDDAHDHLALPAPRRSILRFRVRTQDGTVTFSEVDAVRRTELAPVIVFARKVAQQVCGLPR